MNSILILSLLIGIIGLFMLPFGIYNVSKGKKVGKDDTVRGGIALAMCGIIYLLVAPSISYIMFTSSNITSENRAAMEFVSLSVLSIFGCGGGFLVVTAIRDLKNGRNK